MDYKQFINQLPKFSNNWTPGANSSASEPFQRILDELSEQNTTVSSLQLLNWAVHCLEADEIYCQIGCFPEAMLIGALFNQPEIIAYTVDNLAESENIEIQLDQLSESIENFGLEDQVMFCQQEVSEFVVDLKAYAPDTKIGVYFYNASPDYRSVFLNLQLILPFLASRAIIIINNSNWSSVQQATADFLLTQSQSNLLLNLPTPSTNYPTFGNGIQVLAWDQGQINYNQPPIQSYFVHSLKEHSTQFEKEEKINKINRLYQEATKHYQQKQWEAAVAKFQEILTWSSHDAFVLHDLGLAYFQLQQYQPALNCLQEALAIAPLNGLWHYHYAIVLEQAGQHTKAVSGYKLAICFDPNLIDAYNNLGNLYTKYGNFPEAESIYREAITQNCKHYGSYINLGNLLLKLNRLEAAIEIYEMALVIQPNEPDLLHNLQYARETLNDPAKRELNLGKSAYQQKRYQDAIQHYQAYLKTETGNIEAYLNLADCLTQQKQDEQVVSTYKNAIHHHPQASIFYYHLAKALQKLGRIKEAIHIADEAAEKFPEQLKLKLLPKRLLPIIYDYPEEIEIYRKRYTEALGALTEEIVLETLEDKEEALNLIDTSNFFLQYQGKNDVELQQQYGQFVHEVMKANYPEWTQAPTAPSLKANQKLRVGYLSCNLSFHTIGKLAVGWMIEHDPDKIEVYCYHLGTKVDQMTQQFAQHSHQFRHIPEGLKTVCQQILADELDILVYLDIGLDTKVTQLAGLRLAPIQCQTWLHPVTSGIPTIDYFLSSELMEPENGPEHYTETLIRLPNLGIAYPKPKLPEQRKSRQEFQLPEEAVLYLCCQSTYKYLPQDDDIFPSIAQQVPKAQFIFLGSPVSNSLDQKFQQRLQRSFASFDLEMNKYCCFLPRLLPEDYLSLNLVADIFLDSLGWSGGNTTLEAIACNLPIVTCPGEFMRGRHSYGILKRLGVTETIASTKEEYIEIAIKLGLNHAWRQQLRQNTSQNHSNLYADAESVKGLESFYHQALQRFQP